MIPTMFSGNIPLPVIKPFGGDSNKCHYPIMHPGTVRICGVKNSSMHYTLCMLMIQDGKGVMRDA